MTNGAPQAYRLRLLGVRDLRSPEGDRVSSVLAQPKRLCLLAYLALARRPVARSTITALFWPEKDEVRARNSLNQAVFYLRRSMTANVVESVDGGELLHVPEERLWFDVRELLMSETPDATLLAHAERDVMEGWNADDSQPLQEWLDGLRREVHERAATVHGRPPATIAAPAPPRRSSVSAPAPNLPSGLPSPVPDRGRWALSRILGGLTLIGMMAWIAWQTRSAPDAVRTTMLVLSPSVEATANAPPLPATGIRGELVAELRELDGVDVVEAFYAESLSEFRTQAEAIGASEGPDWLLEIVIRVTSGELRTRIILYDASGVLNLVAGDTLVVMPSENLLMAAPEAIAAAAREMARQVVTPR